MHSAASIPPKVRHRKLPLEKRARSVPYRRPYILALLVSATFFLALIGAGAALFAFVAVPGKHAASLLLGFAGFSAILWLFSFFKRRGCHCPLCTGTPFLDNAAHRHEKAIRFFPFNYGTSNVIRALIRQQFRCQYCGTPFDLLKPLNRFQRESSAPPASPASQPIRGLPPQAVSGR